MDAPNKIPVANLFSLKGRRGLITGGSMGIGACLAEAFSELGASVAIAARDLQRAEVKAAEITALTGGKVKAYRCDVADCAEADATVEAVVRDFGGIDFCICNAGIFTGDGVLDISAEDFRKVLDVNLGGVFHVARAAARKMVEQGTGGSIIATASMSGHIVNRPQTIANYCASKAAVIQLVKAMAVELAPHRIRVNSVSPGYIQTELIAGLKDLLPVWQGMMPAGSRLGYPEDLIGAYVYFASDASRYATGSDLVVDGGYTAL